MKISEISPPKMHGCANAVARFLLAWTFLWPACSSQTADRADGGDAMVSTDTAASPTDVEIFVGRPVTQGDCELQDGAAAPEYLTHIGCTADFEALASEPLATTLPGARSVKVVLDQADANALYFQNSVRYQVHYEFASSHLSGNGLPVVGPLADFNTTEYYSPNRRFLLGAVTFYEGPQAWTLEMAPYDTASADRIATLFETVRDAGFFGSGLYFHPTSQAVEREAAKLPSDVPVVTTDQLYAAIDYQPLTLGVGIGRLRFVTAAELDTTYLSYEDLVVLDQAPNDITVVRGLITQAFQTPLSHVNVLAQNRHTPNMGLRGAMSNALLREFEGQLVELTVGAEAWQIRAVGTAEAEAFWQANQPTPVTLPALDLDVTGLVDIEDVTPEPQGSETLRDAIKTAVNAFGGKAAQYSILARTEGVPVRKAFAIPVFYYDQFMGDNGFYQQIDALLADDTFNTDAEVRDRDLLDLREDMMAAPLDEDFQALLQAKLDADYPGLTMRFRTSTNSEDLEGFPCAGCYESHTGDPGDWQSVLDAIRKTYASAWLFRTFEERTYYGVDHKSVGMALLVHHNFAAEEANGVAVTANPFDASGLDPAFYVNVQYGGNFEVVHPVAGVSSDEFLYYFSEPNQPITYLSDSSLVPDGTTVLSTAQIHTLGLALDAIHQRFSAAYGPAAGITGWYAMDVEFKFEDGLYIKQARPYPGRGE